MRCALSSRSMRPSSGASSSATATVPSMTGSVVSPVRTTVASDSPNPETTIAVCSTARAENASPARHSSGRGRTARTATPRTIANTGAPTSGAAWAHAPAAARTGAASRTPGITSADGVRLGDLVHPRIADRFAEVRSREVHVLGARVLDPADRCAFELLLHDRRRAGHDDARRDLRVHADHRAGRDQALVADDGAVQHGRVRADQRALPDAAVLEDRAVADRRALLDHRLAVLAHVHDGVVLHVRAGVDADRAVVAADHGTEPDRRLLAHLDVADQHGGRGHERGRRHLRALAAVLDDHCAPPQKEGPRSPIFERTPSPYPS